MFEVYTICTRVVLEYKLTYQVQALGICTWAVLEYK